MANKKNTPVKNPRTPAKVDAVPPNTNTIPDLGRQPIVIQDNQITITQLFRGNQDVQSWYQAVLLAEQLRSPNRRFLLQNYIDVSIDLHLKSQMAKRTRAVKTTPFEWPELTSEGHLENLQSPWFMELLDLIQSRIFWGTTLGEIKLGDDGLIGDIELVPRQNVKPEFGVISIDGSSNTGIPYREGLYKNYILEIGRPRDLGLLANLAPLVILKRQNFADFSRYNEMFGMPCRVYEYDPLQPGAREQVTAQAKAQSTAAYIILPKGQAQVTLVEAKQSSSTQAYDTFHSILNGEITTGILGQTLTTGGDKGGSFNLGKVHKSVEEEINMEDRLYAEYVINYPFRKNILIPHGYPLENIKGKFKLIDELPKELKANMWTMFAKAGLEIAKEDFYTEFGVPMPGDKDVLEVPATFTPDNAPDPNNPQASQPAGTGTKDKPAGGAGGKKSAELRDHYRSKHKTASTNEFITLSYNSDLNKIIDNIITQLSNGSLKPGDVDPALFELVGGRLFAAVEKGYGTTLAEAEGNDSFMLNTLRENVYRFSGFKSYHFVKEANALLVDEAGKVKPFDLFKKDILALNKEYNVNFLRTEYNHAVATSQMASKWQSIKADKGVLPLLEFVTVGDGRVRAAHQALDGIIRPVDDPFWKTHYPPLDYNCRCTVKQLADGKVSDINHEDIPKPKKGFGINWGEERVIFSPDHPQFSVDPADQDSADDNFGLELPKS